jgi:hypothetical protein
MLGRPVRNGKKLIAVAVIAVIGFYRMSSDWLLVPPVTRFIEDLRKTMRNTSPIAGLYVFEVGESTRTGPEGPAMERTKN